MRINVNLEPDVYDALMEFADEEKLTLPQAVNDALADYFDVGEEEGEEEEA